MKKSIGLADRIRPETLEDFLGQDEILGQDKIISIKFFDKNIKSR